MAKGGEGGSSVGACMQDCQGLVWSLLVLDVWHFWDADAFCAKEMLVSQSPVCLLAVKRANAGAGRGTGQEGEGARSSRRCLFPLSFSNSSHRTVRAAPPAKPCRDSPDPRKQFPPRAGLSSASDRSARAALPLLRHRQLFF